MLTTDCQHCGATIRNRSARFCEFCGTEHVRITSEETATPTEQRAERFTRLNHHADLPGLMDRQPEIPPAIPMGAKLFGGAFLVMTSIISIVFLVVGIAMLPFGLILLIPLALIWGGKLLVFGRIKRRVRDYDESELVRRPAIIVAQRTKVSGGGQNSSATTTNFVTIEVEDGRRDEFRTPDEVYGVLTVGDAGVAYLKFDLLLDFQRVAV
jgi:Protein of unknown function (DUF2500)